MLESLLIKPATLESRPPYQLVHASAGDFLTMIPVLWFHDNNRWRNRPLSRGHFGCGTRHYICRDRRGTGHGNEAQEKRCDQHDRDESFLLTTSCSPPR